jgi:hypothetical protein
MRKITGTMDGYVNNKISFLLIFKCVIGNWVVLMLSRAVLKLCMQMICGDNRSSFFCCCCIV